MSSPQPNNTQMSRAVFFPDELNVEILSLLNAKSLMRLKRVCKSWNLLISDPTFIKLHLKRSARNPHIAIKNSNSHYGITTFLVRSLFENTSISLSEISNSYFTNNMGPIYIIGSCNGLLCLFGYSNRYIDVLLYLWNPATRTLSNKIVFLSGEEDEPDFDLLTRRNFTFGYDNSTDTYKIVAFGDTKVRILNVGEDNVWRDIQSFPVVPLDNTDFFHMNYDLATNCGVYVSGTINWVAFLSEYVSKNNRFVIISLDLSNETYRQLKTPPVFDEVPYQKQNLVVLMDSLCVSHDFNGTHFIIWQMKEYGVEDSWTQLLKFSYQSISIDHELFLFPLCLSENDDILILALPSFDNKAGFLYSFRDNRVEQETRIVDPKKWYVAKDYVESLVPTS